MKVSKQGRLHSPIAGPTHFILFLSLNLPNPISPSNLASNFHLYLTAIDCSSRNEGRRKTGNLRCRFSRVRFLEGLLGPRSQGHGTRAGMDREGLFWSCFFHSLWKAADSSSKLGQIKSKAGATFLGICSQGCERLVYLLLLASSQWTTKTLVIARSPARNPEVYLIIKASHISPGYADAPEFY